MAIGPRKRTSISVKEEREDKMIGLMEAAGHYMVIGLVAPGEMEEIYGRLLRVK
jgi:hypothetical protein